MTQDKISEVEKKEEILTLEQARGMEGFWDYRNGVYKYKQNGIVRLIHKGKDVAKKLGVKWICDVKFNDKNELAFIFIAEKGCGAWYNGEVIFKQKVKWAGGLQFDHGVWQSIKTISHEELKKTLDK